MPAHPWNFLRIRLKKMTQNISLVNDTTILQGLNVLCCDDQNYRMYRAPNPFPVPGENLYPATTRYNIIHQIAGMRNLATPNGGEIAVFGHFTRLGGKSSRGLSIIDTQTFAVRSVQLLTKDDTYVDAVCIDPVTSLLYIATPISFLHWFTEDWSKRGSAPMSFNYVTWMAYHAGKLWVTNGNNNTLYTFQPPMIWSNTSRFATYLEQTLDGRLVTAHDRTVSMHDGTSWTDTAPIPTASIHGLAYRDGTVYVSYTDEIWTITSPWTTWTQLIKVNASVVNMGLIVTSKNIYLGGFAVRLDGSAFTPLPDAVRHSSQRVAVRTEPDTLLFATYPSQGPDISADLTLLRDATTVTRFQGTYPKPAETILDVDKCVVHVLETDNHDTVYTMPDSTRGDNTLALLYTPEIPNDFLRNFSPSLRPVYNHHDGFVYAFSRGVMYRFNRGTFREDKSTITGNIRGMSVGLESMLVYGSQLNSSSLMASGSPSVVSWDTYSGAMYDWDDRIDSSAGTGTVVTGAIALGSGEVWLFGNPLQFTHIPGTHTVACRSELTKEWTTYTFAGSGDVSGGVDCVEYASTVYARTEVNGEVYRFDWATSTWVRVDAARSDCSTICVYQGAVVCTYPLTAEIVAYRGPTAVAELMPVPTYYVPSTPGALQVHSVAVYNGRVLAMCYHNNDDPSRGKVQHVFFDGNRWLVNSMIKDKVPFEATYVSADTTMFVIHGATHFEASIYDFAGNTMTPVRLTNTVELRGRFMVSGTYYPNIQLRAEAGGVLCVWEKTRRAWLTIGSDMFIRDQQRIWSGTEGGEVERKRSVSTGAKNP
jgi:hypothetical protein